MIFPTFIMGSYSARMYKSAIAQEIPVRNLKRRSRKAKKYISTDAPNSHYESKSLYQRLKKSSYQERQESLSQSDIQSLFEAASSATFVGVSYLKTLFHISCLCRKDREANAIYRTSGRYERMLDTRKLVTTHTNLSLLLRLMLSREQ